MRLTTLVVRFENNSRVCQFLDLCRHCPFEHVQPLPSPARPNQAFDLMSLPMIINILSSSLAPRNAPRRRPPRLLSHASGTPARVHCMTRPGMLLHRLLSPFSRSVALLVISYHTFVHLEWMGLPCGAVRGLSISKSISNAEHFFIQQLHSSSYLAFDCCCVFPSQHVVAIAPVRTFWNMVSHCASVLPRVFQIDSFT